MRLELNRFERILYYPVAFAWTIFTVHHWSDSSFNVIMGAASLIGAVAIWALPFVGHRQPKTSRVFLWISGIPLLLWVLYVSYLFLDARFRYGYPA